MVEIGMMLAFVTGMIGFYLLVWILLRPMKIVGKLLLNSVLGGVSILLLNLLGGSFGVHVSLNPLTSALVGLLGIPGLILCLFLF